MSKLVWKQNKRNYIGAAVLAALLALAQVVGYSFSKVNSWDLWFQNGTTLRRFVPIFLFLTVFFFLTIFIFWNLLDRGKQNTENIEVGKMDIRSWLLITGGMILFWIPYLIILYPCSANPDVVDQLGQFFHIDSMCKTQGYVNLPNPEISFWNNHHPVFHTLILGVFAQIGKGIGNIEIGLFLLVIIQAVLMAMTFSYMVLYMREEGVSKKICLATILFYMIWPLNGITATTLCKDTLFTVLILYNTVRMLKLLKRPEKMFKKKELALNIITFILMGLIRNNGLYVLLFMSLIMLILLKHYRKQVIILMGVPIFVLGIILPKIIFPMLEIAPGSEREMLSIPFQQVARLLKEEKVENSDIKVIERTLAPNGEKYHAIVKRYDPKRADSVKSHYNLKLTSGEKIEFFKVWLKYLFKYPMTYIQAAVNTNYQYIYYERYSDSLAYVYYNGIDIQGRYFMGIKNNARFEKLRNTMYDTITKVQHNKYLGWIFNIGFYMCIFIILMGKSIVNRDYRLFWGFGLILGNILINFLGPVVYMRYAYYFIVSIPLCLGLLTRK